MEQAHLSEIMHFNKINPGANILVIDDEYLSTFICERFIKRVVHDSNITTCSSGKQALDLLAERKKRNPALLPDYIFIDIAMPGMNGWQFLDEYIRINIDPLGKSKIYILTASLFMHDMKRSELYPIVSDYIIKPLDCEKVKKALTGLVEN